MEEGLKEACEKRGIVWKNDRRALVRGQTGIDEEVQEVESTRNAKTIEEAYDYDDDGNDGGSEE